MTLEAPRKNKVVSIQVQTTKLTGAGVQVVPWKVAGNDATHWSLYLRYEDGNVEWVQDLRVSRSPAEVYGEAMLVAAKLSMEHQAFIEKVV